MIAATLHPAQLLLFCQMELAEISIIVWEGGICAFHPKVLNHFCIYITKQVHGLSEAKINSFYFYELILVSAVLREWVKWFPSCIYSDICLDFLATLHAAF